MRSTLLATRRGGTSVAWRYQRLHLHQKRRALHGTQHHRAGSAVASPTKRALASSTSTRPCSCISNTPTSLVEPAVLERLQRPVGALALALEGEHAVQRGGARHARPGERALGHVPDEHHRHGAFFAMRISRPATSCTWPTEPGLPDRLGRTAPARSPLRRLGALGLDRGQYGIEVRVGHYGHAQRGRSEALRPQLHLRR